MVTIPTPVCVRIRELTSTIAVVITDFDAVVYFVALAIQGVIQRFYPQGTNQQISV